MKDETIQTQDLIASEEGNTSEEKTEVFPPVVVSFFTMGRALIHAVCLVDNDGIPRIVTDTLTGSWDVELYTQNKKHDIYIYVGKDGISLMANQ